MIKFVACYYLLLFISYLLVRTYFKNEAYKQLRSRSDMILWYRDFTGYLNIIILPVILLPLIALVAYVIIAEDLNKSEILVYSASNIIFFTTLYFASKNYGLLIKHTKQLYHKKSVRVVN